VFAKKPKQLPRESAKKLKKPLVSLLRPRLRQSKSALKLIRLNKKDKRLKLMLRESVVKLMKLQL